MHTWKKKVRDIVIARRKIGEVVMEKSVMFVFVSLSRKTLEESISFK